MFTSASLLHIHIPLETNDRIVSLYTPRPPPPAEVVDSDEEELEGEHVDPQFQKKVLECLDRMEASQDLLLQGQEKLLKEFQDMQLTQSEILHLLRTQFPPPQ